MNTYRDKGAELLTCLQLSPAEATQRLRQSKRLGAQEHLRSRFTTHKRLSKQGWVQETNNIGMITDNGWSSYPEVDAAYKELRMATTPRNFTTSSWDYNYNGPSSKRLGFYQGTYNPRAGLIVSVNSQSPHRKRDGTKLSPVPGQTLPDLHHWSDVVFLAYQHQCAEDFGDADHLKHIFRLSISTKTDAYGVIKAMLGADHRLPFIAFNERREFAADTEEAKALFGTPTGAGVAWMLLRQPDLARKVVKSVAIFGRLRYMEHDAEVLAEYEDMGGPHLYFEIGDRQ